MPRLSRSATALSLRQFQSEVDAIRETPVWSGPRLAVRLLACMILIMGVLTVIVPVNRVVTSSSGKIVPTDAISVFQALDPSVIKSVDVHEGEAVSAGQVLARLDPTFAAADVSQLRLQLFGLDAQIERATAELAHRAPTFVHVDDPLLGRYAAIQQTLYVQRSAQYKAQLASFANKISQTEATIKKFQNDEDRYAEREKVSKQIEDMRATLAEHQTGSLLNLYISQDSRLEMMRFMEFGHNSLLESRQQLASLQQDQEAFKQQWAATLSQEIVIARNARNEVGAALAKASRRNDLVILRAPEAGVILTRAKLSVGSVLKEGDSLLTMMPARSPVEAEIHIASRDVGFLRNGDRATLKIDAFNSAEHGTAEGHVSWISAGAFTTDDDGKPTDAFYKVHLAIDALHFTGVPKGFRLLPGMTLTADMQVGRRSVARYLIGGGIQGFGEAMREP